MPQPYRDPHSLALVFVPSREEREVQMLKEDLTKKTQELDKKTLYLESLIKKAEEVLKES